MPLILKHPIGRVQIDELPNSKKHILVHSLNKSLFIPRKSCETHYPMDLIRLILEVKGPAFLCDEILREEDPSYVQLHLEKALLGYVDARYFVNKRLLDFGCGSAASTINLSRLFPHTEIVGIEHDLDLLSIAKLRTQYYAKQNITYFLSPSYNHLPEDLGFFNFIVLSAVYEHLLPTERHTLLQQLWSLLSPNGILFIDHTPHRYFPLEWHTTKLPFINYLPARLALIVARTFSKRVKLTESWESLLRRGIRGGTVREIMGILHNQGNSILLKPCRLGLHDRIDLFYAQSATRNPSKGLRLLKLILKTFQAFSGITLTPYLSLAIRKTNQ